jgi:hypothetical protein
MYVVAHAHGAATTKPAALDSASHNGTALPESIVDSDPSESDEDSDSDADAGTELLAWTRLENPTMGTCPLCLDRRRLPWSTYDRGTDKDVAVCGRCHSCNERNDRTFMF